MENTPDTPPQGPELMPEWQIREDPFAPQSAHTPSSTTSPLGEWQSPERLTLTQLKRRRSVRLAAAVVGGITAIMLIIFGVVKYQQTAFDPSRVAFQLNAPASLEATQDVQFSITYTNDNRARLNDAEVTLYYPTGFQITQMGPGMTLDGSIIRIKIGTIAGHATGRYDLTGRFSGARDSLAYLKAVLRYTPDNNTSAFEKASQASLALQSSSLVIDIEAPLEVATGSIAEYLVSYTNTSDQPLTNMRLKVTYPERFTFTSADPKPSEGTAVWYLGTIAAHQSGKIRMSGTLDGIKGQTATFHTDFGILQGNGDLLVYAASERTTRLTASPLALTQTVNGGTKFTAHAGSTLSYTIQYKNQGPVALRNNVVTLEFRSDIFDLSRAETGRGSYDANRKTITWKASEVSKLGLLLPGDGGEILFSVPLQSRWDVRGDQDKNPVVMTVATMDSPDIPTPTGANKLIASNTLSVPVGTTMNIAATATYTDTQIANTGPVSPVVGTESTYTLHWTVGNSTSDLKDGVVRATLAPNVRWTGKTVLGSESVTYNERTNEITWNLGGVEAGTGLYKPARSVAFQVGFTPAPNQSTRLLQEPVLNATTMTATDTFTTEALTTTAVAVNVSGVK